MHSHTIPVVSLIILYYPTPTEIAVQVSQSKMKALTEKELKGECYHEKAS